MKNKSKIVNLENEAASEHSIAMEGIARAIEVNRVCGDALYGLHEWHRALDCFERILSLRPKDRDANVAAGNCMAILSKETLRDRDAENALAQELIAEIIREELDDDNDSDDRGDCGENHNRCIDRCNTTPRDTG